MYSNYRRQGSNSRSNSKHLEQKPVNQVVKPMQILKRPDQESSGEKIISLPTLSNINKSKKEVNHVINSCIKTVIENSPVAYNSSESTKPSRRKSRNKDSKSSLQFNSKQTPLTYHSDGNCSEKASSSKLRYKSSRPSKESLVDKKEDAAVKLLMVLLNTEISEQKPTLPALPLKTSSKTHPKPRAQEDKVISPLSLLELLQPTPSVNVKPNTKSYGDNYYAAPQFRKPPRLSELPVPPFLTV